MKLWKLKFTESLVFTKIHEIYEIQKSLKYRKIAEIYEIKGFHEIHEKPW